MSQRQVLQVFEQYRRARTQFAQAVAELAARPQNVGFLQSAGVVSLLRPLLLDVVPTVQQSAALALGRLADCSNDLAEAVVKGDVLPQLLCSLTEQNLSQLIVNAGGVAAVIDCIGSCRGTVRLPGIMTLGYVAAHSENLSMAVIVSKGIPPLCACLIEEHEDHIKAAAAWALGQIGRHTPEHAHAVAVTNVLPTLLAMYMDTRSSEDLQMKTKRALKNILQKCTHLPALELLLHDAPPNIMKYIVGQFSKVLRHDSKARRLFVTTGGLKKIQEINAEPGSLLQEYISAIKSCYPEEVVRYYSPGYPETLLERVENYHPVL